MLCNKLYHKRISISASNMECACTTRLVLTEVDLATVMQLMGHASISTTMKYAHPAPPHKREAVERLDLSQPAQQSLDVVSLSE
jgi:site-specific recombinase XerD